MEGTSFWDEKPPEIPVTNEGLVKFTENGIHPGGDDCILGGGSSNIYPFKGTFESMIFRTSRERWEMHSFP